MDIKTTQRLYMKKLAARRAKILAMRAKGFKWREIGLEFGITRQRAQQIGGNK